MPKVNERDVERTETDRADADFRRQKLAAAAGGEDLGCSRYELPPGGKSWPYHYHTGNEEALYVLSGAGTLRLDGDTVSLEAGDYVALPSGEAGAHRVVNDGDAPLRYLALSTMRDPDVTVYPDSDWIGVFAGSPPGGEGERDVSGHYRREETVDYWEG